MPSLGSRLGLLGALALAGLPAPSAAQPVGSEFQVNAYTPYSQRTYPRDEAIAADANGNFVVVWSSSLQDPSGYGVFGQRYDSQGKALGEEFQVNTYVTGHQFSPSVGRAPDGQFVVVWNGSGAGDPYFGIFGQRYDSEGHALGDEFRVNTTTGGPGRQENPSVALDAAGNFVVVWDCDTGNPYNRCGAYGQRFGSDGSPRGSEFQFGSDSVGNPTAAFGAAGSFVVVYDQRPVYGQRYDAQGMPLGNAFRISPGGLAGDPAVSSDAAGNFVVVWDAMDADARGIFGQRFDSAGQPRGAAFQVNTYTTDRQYGPSVASDATGSFLVAWESLDQDGDGWGVFGRRYDSDGVAQGADFRINSWTSANQRSAAGTATGPERFVVVWSSYYQDGHGIGVFGQRYDFGGAQAITVVNPNSEVKWRIGALERIQWIHTLGADATFRIELDRDDDGDYEELIAAAAPVDSPTKGSFAWTVTGPRSGTARVRVSWTDDSAVSDASDVTFQIRPAGLESN